MSVTAPEQIPTDLLELANWVVWRYVEADNGKPTKVPFQSRNTRVHASSTSSATWSTFEVAQAAVERDSTLEGLGFVFTQKTGITGIDIDACIDPETGEMEAWAKKIVRRMDTYTEISPSGFGVKLWCYAEAPNRKRNVHKELPPWPHGKPRGLEMYDRERYFAVTGRRWPGTPLEVNERQDVIDALFNHYWPEDEQEEQPAPMPSRPNTVADRELLEKAFNSRNGEAIRTLYNGETKSHAGDDSAADLALCNHLAFYTGRDAARMDALFRGSGLMRKKWDERHGKLTYGQMTIQKAIEATRETYSPSGNGVMVDNHFAGAGKMVTRQASGISGELNAEVDPKTGEIVAPRGIVPIDWAAFWATDHKQEDWLLEPILPRGRSIALYAPAKAGKSLFMLNILARMASGQAVLDRPAGDPVDVCYFDMEMTETDLYERLADMGFGPDSDLSHLHYYMLPTLPPLDTPEGGATVMMIVRRHEAVVVAIDTTSRVLKGPENDADTLRALYVCTGLPLKAAGTTVIRLDHAGKNLELGQRGTSAKNDDVDLVWQLTTQDNGIQLRATHRRQSWIPETVDLAIEEDPLRYKHAAITWPNGTTDAARQLDKLGLSAKCTNKEAREAMAANGMKMRNSLLAAALRYRRGQAILNAESVPQNAGNAVFGASGNESGNDGESDSGNARGTRGTGSEAYGERSPTLVGERFHSSAGKGTCGICTLPGELNENGMCRSCSRLRKRRIQNSEGEWE